LHSVLIAYYSNSYTSWDEDLIYLQLTFNTVKHESTQMTLFEVMFPICMCFPLFAQMETLINCCLIHTRCNIQKVWTNVHQSLFQRH
jgi:hypothetical protein